MATERDFELLDDYLGNRLGLDEKSAFEQKLASDPELKKELEFQQALVRGIRNERMAELKSMLNNVPVPPAGLSAAAKAVITLSAAAVVSLAVYFMLDTTPEQPEAITEHIQQQEPSAAPEETPATDTSPSGTLSDTNEAITSDKKETPEQGQKPSSDNSAPKAEKRNDAAGRADTQAARQPELNVFDPSAELEEEEESKPENVIIEQEETTEAIKRSSIAVETDNTDKKYNFHYQFRDSKLVLYGSFDKNLIEILEFFSGNKHTIFLYFNSNYYLLDEQQTKPASLKPITDQALLSKLKEYRGK